MDYCHGKRASPTSISHIVCPACFMIYPTHFRFPHDDKKNKASFVCKEALFGLQRSLVLSVNKAPF